MPTENRSSNTEQMVSAPFEREARYLVIKLSKLDAGYATGELYADAELAKKIEKLASSALIDCVVIEKDWPEYEPVWSMIEARVTGKPTSDGFSAEQMTTQGADGYRNGIKAAAELAAYYPELAQAIRDLPLPQ
ncbi:hypothetical protein D3C77_210420 [compost metagenome]